MPSSSTVDETFALERLLSCFAPSPFRPTSFREGNAVLWEDGLFSLGRSVGMFPSLPWIPARADRRGEALLCFRFSFSLDCFSFGEALRRSRRATSVTTRVTALGVTSEGCVTSALFLPPVVLAAALEDA